MTAAPSPLGSSSGLVGCLYVGYLVVRVVVPILLVVLALRGATPRQRIELVRYYLRSQARGRPTGPRAPGR